MTQKDNPQLSFELFQKALQEKRNGNYNNALVLYKQSIYAYLNDPQLQNTFYAMAKVFYLDKQYSNSIHCYDIYLSLLLAKNTNLLNYSSEDVFYSLAHNMGWALLTNYFENNNDIAKIIDGVNYYRLELSGHETDNMMYAYTFYKNLDKEATKAAHDRINTIINNHEQNLQSELDKKLDLAKYILSII